MFPVYSRHRSMLDQLVTSLCDSDVWETAKIFMKHGQVTVGNRYVHFFDNEYCIKCQYTTLLMTVIVKCLFAWFECWKTILYILGHSER